MKGQEDKLVETLLKPNVVIQSQSDETVRLFHRFYSGTTVGDKYLCVVVKYPQKGSAFIVTAYFMDKVKAGEVLWKR
jgi:molybdopterin synthase catalytic subunit